MLLDSFGRIHNYLRISLTDHCNFRCSYCMPEYFYDFMPPQKLMNAEEIRKIAAVFVQQGIDKIRLTGGEPLVRKDFEDILFGLSQLKTELLITTNGALMHNHIDAFKKAGIRTVNVSLDSLRRDRFFEITKRDLFDQVWANIMLLLENDFRVKINAVALSGYIEHEIIHFIRLTKSFPIHVRFIEFMPFAGNNWDQSRVITAKQLLDMVVQEFDIVKLNDEPHATAKKYKVLNYEGTFAFITTMSNQFCGECNRLRLTADGKIKNCLFGKEELDLLSALRRGDDFSQLIQQSVKNKYQAMGGQFEQGYKQTDANELINRSMISIGG